MLIGYARVSKPEQSLSLQEDALKKAGCEIVFSDMISGVKEDRPGLNKAFNALRPGDTLVVWKLDRLGRSIQHLIQTIKTLYDNRITFKSLQDNIDTCTSTGKLIFHIFCSLAEFERDLIVERTQAGLEAARARGKFGGRRDKLTPSELEKLKTIYFQKTLPLQDICKLFNISKQSIYNYIRRID